MKILAKFNYYNANNRNKYVGDCVKRSLSLAFDSEYSDISKKLNELKRPGDVYNSISTINSFLKEFGLTFTNAYSEPDLTEEEFSQKHPTGRYILLTGEKSKAAGGRSSHMVCIIDGTIYDSWDSSNYIVHQYCKVSDASLNFSDTNVLNIGEDLNTFVSEYFDMLVTKKMPYMKDYSTIYYPGDDAYTGQIVIRFKVSEEMVGYKTIYRYLFLTTETTLRKSFGFKLNPRKSDEENLASLKKSLKQRIYDYFYNNYWDQIDRIKKSQDIETNPEFSGDASDLVKFPDWIRSYITYIRLDGNPNYEDRIKVYADPLPGDPRGDTEVYFSGDTLTEVKNQMKDYKQNFSRLDWDY